MTTSADPSTPALRLGFAGTPDFAARILAALIQAGRPPVVVYTQPDRPVGRGRRVQPSPVKQLAQAHGLSVAQPATLRGSDAAEALASWRLDVLVVAAYGLILPPAILDLPRLGCLNVHASLLPRWRGAAPVERAIMAGDAETGVCIMRMERGLDTGPVYTCRRTPIRDSDDGPSLAARLAELGSAALLECLADLPNRTPTPQPEAGVSYASKLGPDDATIMWDRPAAAIDRQIRALRGRLPATTQAGDVRIAILEASVEADVAAPAAPGTILAASRNGIRVACGEGVLRALRVRLSIGKGKPLSAAEASNGFAHVFRPTERLGDDFGASKQ